MITIKELKIDIESGSKIINLIKKHEPEIWKVLKIELKKALKIPDVVGQSEQLCDHEFKNNGKGAEICIKCGLPYAINC
tara:strand:+ start:355 stop:591 length:237 start_codon:yes stop_codon:yes gene_type:complete